MPGFPPQLWEGVKGEAGCQDSRLWCGVAGYRLGAQMPGFHPAQQDGRGIGGSEWGTRHPDTWVLPFWELSRCWLLGSWASGPQDWVGGASASHTGGAECHPQGCWGAWGQMLWGAAPPAL